MRRFRNITSIVTILLLGGSLLASSTLLAVGLLGSSVRSKPASVLLQEGLYAEEIEGDLDAAIKIYEQVITQAKAAEQTAAQATYRLGMCYLKKGEKQKAAERFQNLVSKFPQHESLVAKAQEHLAKLKPPVTITAGFGPVRERVIYDPASSRECFIDFESGEIFKIPEPLRDPNISQARAIEWLTATDVDAQGDTGGSPRSHGLVGFPPYNAAAVEAPGGWNATPETLIAMTRQLTAGGKSKMFAKDPLPTTYYFKTRQGNMGVLQILGFTEGEPRGVRFRYKMLQPGAGKPVVKLEVTTPVYEWWRAEPKVTKTIYEDSQLEIEWDVDPEMGKNILSFGGGVLPIEGDISDIKGHLWWVKNLAFTVRSMPYGKNWDITEGPKPLKSGEYKIYICAFSHKGHITISWPDMLRNHLVGAGTAKLIVKPRPFTGAAAVDVVKHQVFLPDADTPSVNAILDLASGELLPAGEGVHQLTVFREMGKGDLAYDRVLICLRGGKAKLLQEGKLANLEIFGQMEDSTAYKLPKTPCRLVVTTAEGDAYEVKVLSVEGDEAGIHIEYWKSAEAPAEFAIATPVHLESGRKLKTLGRAVVMYANDHNGKLPDTLQELKPYIEHDFQWFLGNVEYLGIGKTAADAPGTVIAYDKTLLEKLNGTNVLFLDAHVEFLKAEELEKLGILDGKEPQTTAILE